MNNVSNKRLIPITMTYSNDNVWGMASSEEGYGKFAIKTTPENLRKAMLRMKFKNKDNTANSHRSVRYIDMVNELVTKGSATFYCWKSSYPKTREDLERLANM